MQGEPLLRKTLKDHGYKVTMPRLLVFAALQSDSPQAMAVVVDTLKDRVDRVSVYRIITLFEQLGIVKRIAIGWKYKLELGDIFSSHHHHIMCLGCGKIVAVRESSEAELLIEKLGQNNGFRVISHQLELQGYCKGCAPQA